MLGSFNKIYIVRVDDMGWTFDDEEGRVKRKKRKLFALVYPRQWGLLTRQVVLFSHRPNNILNTSLSLSAIKPIQHKMLFFFPTSSKS